MNVQIHRIRPDLPDPVESRRSGAGRFVRIVYALCVFAVLGFFVFRFGSPLVFLSGPGIVAAQSDVVSLPYAVQVLSMDVKPGAKVEPGQRLALIRSPQVAETLSNYTRALGEVTGKEADLRVKARIAQASLDAARSRLRVAEDTLRRLESNTGGESASLVYRTEVYRERALALQGVAALEAEAAEAASQLVVLGETRQRIQRDLERTEREFDDGKVLAPVSGIVSAQLAKIGATVLAGTSIAEIYQADDLYVDWYIPAYHLTEPQPGTKVFVVAGKNRINGTISELLPLSEAFDARRSSILSEPLSGQVARIRLEPGSEPPVLNATVEVRMYYSETIRELAEGLARLVGVERSPS